MRVLTNTGKWEPIDDVKMYMFKLGGIQSLQEEQ